MNEAMENMLTRRSCRKYLDKPVPEDLLEQVLLAGAYAPSAMNRQPGKVVVLRDPEEIRELEQWNSEIAGGGRVGTHMFYGAPVVLVVLAKRYSTSVIYCWRPTAWVWAPAGSIVPERNLTVPGARSS